jgi:hypothetical protein
MRSKLWVVVVVAVAAVITLSCAGTAQAARSHATPACATPGPAWTVPRGAHLVEDIIFRLRNGEDAGNVGYWALDNSIVQVRVWRVPDGTFYALFQVTDGRWTTYVGAFSPVVGVPEQAQGSGTYGGWWTVTFSGAVIPGQKMFGYLGTIDFGGTPYDISLGTYAAPQTGNTNSWDPIASYFTSPNNFNDETLLQMWEVYRYKCQTLIYTATSITGDIVVTK